MFKQSNSHLCSARSWLLLAAVCVLIGVSPASYASNDSNGDEQKVDKLVVATARTPWLPAYRAVAKAYTKKTGVEIEFRVMPFSELPTQEITDALNEAGNFDVYQINEADVGLFYSGGMVKPFKAIDPNYEPDKAINSYDGVGYWNAELGITSREGGQLMGLPLEAIRKYLPIGRIFTKSLASPYRRLGKR